MSASPRLVVRDASGEERQVTCLTDDRIAVDGVEVTIRHHHDGSVQVDGPVRVQAWTAVVDDETWVFVDGRTYVFAIEAQGTRRRRSKSAGGPMAAPMPATVRKISVAPGDRVTAGAVLIVLEAMKMELPVKAATSGVVRRVNCAEGAMVQPGEPLIEIDDETAPGEPAP